MSRVPVGPVMTRSSARKNPLTVVTFLLLLVESLSGATGALSATPDAREPFETITLTVHAVGSAALGSFTDNWDPSAGARVELSAPAYAGLARAGVHVFGHEALSPKVPSFDSAYVYLAWAYEWAAPLDLAWAAGARMGAVYMRFDDETTPRARRFETELGFGVASTLTYALAPDWSVVLQGEYRKVLTKQPIEYVLLGVGLGRTFSTPRWLRELLD